MENKNIITKFINTYFDPVLEPRVQAFNLLGFAGVAMGVVSAFAEVLTDRYPMHIILNLLAAAVGIFALYNAKRTGRYLFWSLFIISAIFLIGFPVLYFTGFGYGGNMPAYFIFAIIYTAFLLESKLRVVFVVGEFIIYTACCFIEYRYLEPLAAHASEFAHMRSVITGIISVGLMLFLVVVLYMRIYNNRRKQLEEADKYKTEFYQNMHHDIRTPLNVINTDIQNAETKLMYGVDKAMVQEKLQHAQQEILRLSRMIENSIDNAYAQVKNLYIEAFDYAALLREKISVFRTTIEKNESRLTMQIPENLPKLVGNADILTQVIVNIIMNAHNHTKNGEITVSLKQTGGNLITEIKDTGTGIPPDVLPHVFERGVSSDGTGYGLSISKTFIEMHGGGIGIESEPGNGTAVTFSLPIKGKAGKGKYRE
jgi:signal transduction histidine kinase